eukprot:COSAG01_NODE_7688_length_3098_cov_71.936646_2_plen_65_part_00
MAAQQLRDLKSLTTPHLGGPRPHHGWKRAASHVVTPFAAAVVTPFAAAVATQEDVRCRSRWWWP